MTTSVCSMYREDTNSFREHNQDLDWVCLTVQIVFFQLAVINHRDDLDMLAAKSERTILQFKNKLCDYCIEKPVEIPSYISNHLTPLYQNEINAYIEYMKCPLTVELMDIFGIAPCPVAINHHHLKLLPMSLN